VPCFYGEKKAPLKAAPRVLVEAIGNWFAKNLGIKVHECALGKKRALAVPILNEVMLGCVGKRVRKAGML